MLEDSLVTGFLYRDQLEAVATLDAAEEVDARFIYVTKSHGSVVKLVEKRERRHPPAV